MLQTLVVAATAYGGPARPALRPDPTRALGVRMAATNPLLSAADRFSYQGESTLPATREPLPALAGRVVPVRPRVVDVPPADEPPATPTPALGGLSAGALLQRYGTLYLMTSAALSVISFALCYVAVAHALRSGGLPAWCSIAAARSGRAGLFGIAYATHKALSPVRLPIVLALMQPLARWRTRRGDESSAAAAAVAGAEGPKASS